MRLRPAWKAPFGAEDDAGSDGGGGDVCCFWPGRKATGLLVPGVRSYTMTSRQGTIFYGELLCLLQGPSTSWWHHQQPRSSQAQHGLWAEQHASAAAAGPPPPSVRRR